ncbi:MAG: serine/threonine-protein kinase [Pseudanabaenaceae cyanobacterium bins.39]|nr:serine/threonine-protein kinase [Pseudanabaenaceae cyanobacterium bins.39]
MHLCINPHCPTPDHADNDSQTTCMGCGSDLLIDDTYTVTRLLSDSGGFGMVYEVAEPSGKLKILKVLKQDLNNDEKAVSLFQQEAFVLGQIEHAGIPKIEAYVHHHLKDGSMLHGIVMQKIEGLNLEQWINERQHKPIAQKRAIAWLKQLVEILNLVHSKGYFHRDIKPANIMLSPSGQLVLIDFGTAREATHTYLAKIGGAQGVTSICSVGYTAPEQEKGFAIPQSDFYALGCTMIHLLTGKYPLDLYNPDQDIFDWRGSAPELTEELADLIDAMIARKPSDRPLNCAAILKVLQVLKEVDQLDALVGDRKADQKLQAKRKSIRNSAKQAIKDSTRRPPSPLSLTLTVVFAALVGLGIGTAIKVSMIGNFEEVSFQLPVLQKKRLNPMQFITEAHTDTVQSLALSPNAKLLASASDDSTVKIWQLDGDLIKPNYTIRDQGGWLRSVVFLSDTQVITAGQDKVIKLIEINSGKILRQFKGHTNLISQLAIAPTMDLLASASYDNTVNLWQISTGKLLISLKGHQDKVLGVAISPDAGLVFSASRDRTIKIWDIKTGKLQQTLEGSQGEITCLLVTPNGKQVISGGSDRVIRIWDIATGKQEGILVGHEQGIRSLAITSDGKYLFSGTNDSPNSIRLWNLATRASIWELIGHRDLVTALIVSDRNHQLISGSQDKNIAIWNIPQQLLTN